MIEMRAAIDCMAATVCCTAAPPSRAWEAACCAMASVRRALSAFCLIEAVACSSVAEVSSTEAACSEADCDRLCEVLETWVEAEDRLSAAARTVVRVLSSLARMVYTASITLLTRTPEDARPIDRSPAAIACARRATAAGSPPSWRVKERVIHVAMNIARASAAKLNPNPSMRAVR
ncbi:hypothetical protein GALL_309550 [mine drainage metagenome]|uniref:Uncharacterized protein n=1 Tax=mine drainage metagenome TaxID=410659 RepID=A0A1J5R538_9ZZZZ